MPSVSKSQQRFMGMVRAVQKGDMKAPSKEVADAAKSMKKKDAKDFAKTKHKNLPEKKDATMDKAAKGTVPNMLEHLGGGKPLNSALIQSLLFGGAGYLGGKAIGGLRNYWIGEDDKERTDTIAKRMALAGAGLGVAANVPGLMRNVGMGHYAGLSKAPVGTDSALQGGVGNKARYLKRLFSYLNTTKDQTSDPKFMNDYFKTLGPEQQSQLSSMLSEGGVIAGGLSHYNAADKDLIGEMVADNVRRKTLEAKGAWTPGELTPYDYPYIEKARAEKFIPHVSQLTDYVNRYSTLPAGARTYINSQTPGIRTRADSRASAGNAGGFGYKSGSFTGIEEIGTFDTFLPPDRSGFGFPAHYTQQQIENDPYLSPTAKAQAINVISNASGGRAGLITGSDITRAAVGAGIGYVGAKLFGKVLDGVFGGLAPPTHKKLQQTGTIAGLLLNTGVISR